MNKLYEKQNQEYKKSVELKKFCLDDKIPKEKIDEIKKQQQEAYDKYNFVRGLRNAIEKRDK